MNYFGKETSFAALGKTWTLSRLTRGILERWLEWAKTKIESPLEVIRKNLDKWPPELQDKLISQALDRCSVSVTLTSPAAQALLNSYEGAAHLLYLLLQQHHPGVTPDDAMDIILDAGLEASLKSFSEAGGTPPKKDQPS